MRADVPTMFVQTGRVPVNFTPTQYQPLLRVVAVIEKAFIPVVAVDTPALSTTIGVPVGLPFLLDQIPAFAELPAPAVTTLRKSDEIWTSSAMKNGYR
jgi:hypothetical protein